MSVNKETINTLLLWPEGSPACTIGDECQPCLDIYLVKTKRPLGAIIIFPGGSYALRADHEGHDVAKRFNDAGLHAFVVQYRVRPHVHPAAFWDALKALQIVRENSKQWKINPKHIAVCGFSAGGHL